MRTETKNNNQISKRIETTTYWKCVINMLYRTILNFLNLKNSIVTEMLDPVAQHKNPPERQTSNNKHILI